MTALKVLFEQALQTCPIIAILRGIKPDDVIGIAEVLWHAGIRVVEVPLNSPEPFVSIKMLRSHFTDRMIVGAGTVLEVEEVKLISEVGGQIIVSPNTNHSVITASVSEGCIPIPGFATVTEAFDAIKSGAHFLKLFPAHTKSKDFMSSLQMVIPDDITVIAVGGVSTDNIANLLESGLGGVGVGSSLYRAGMGVENIKTKATDLVAALTAKNNALESVQCLSDVKAGVGEGPAYCTLRDEIIWVDATQPNLFRYNLSSGKSEKKLLEKQLSKIIIRNQTDLFGIGANTIYKLNWDGVITDTIMTVPGLHPGCILNDAVMDKTGHLWVGSMHRGLLCGQGQVFRIDTDTQVDIMGEGFGVCNGLGFSPDGNTLYMVDTLSRTLIAFDTPERTCHPLHGRIISDFMNIPGKPDGLVVCPKGHIWVAMWGGGCLVEILPNGQIHRRVDLPTPNPNAPILIPDDASSIFVTTSRMRLTESDLLRAPWSGELLQVNL